MVQRCDKLTNKHLIRIWRIQSGIQEYGIWCDTDSTQIDSTQIASQTMKWSLQGMCFSYQKWLIHIIQNIKSTFQIEKCVTYILDQYLSTVCILENQRNIFQISAQFLVSFCQSVEKSPLISN